MHPPSLPSSEQGSSDTSRLKLWRLCDRSVEPPARATEESQPKAACSFVTLPFRSTKESDAAISKSPAYLQELHMQLPACLLRAAGARGSLAVPLLKKKLVGKGKTGQYLWLFQAKVVPRQVLLGSPSLKEKNPYDSDYKEILG